MGSLSTSTRCKEFHQMLIVALRLDVMSFTRACQLGLIWCPIPMTVNNDLKFKMLSFVETHKVLAFYFGTQQMLG